MTTDSRDALIATDDVIERAARDAYPTLTALNAERRRSFALGARWAGAEPRATLLRLADEMERAEWPGTGEEARAVVETIADTLRDEAALSGAGTAVDREALVGQALAETIPDGAVDDETFDRVKAAVLTALAARGDAATPTEVEWGVRRGDDVYVIQVPRDAESPDYAEDTARRFAGYGPRSGQVVQRTVSAWRVVS